jgi:WD40 repeat protein
VDRFPAHPGTAQDLTFTGDGKKMVLVDQYSGLVRVWDFASAKEERSFPVTLPVLNGKSYIVARTALSPDGKTVVATYQEWRGGVEFGGLLGPPQHVRLWDVATGTELPNLNDFRLVDKAFSPDGRLALTTGGMVWEIATGKQVGALGDGMFIRAAAFSRDGRLLATTGPRDVIQVWLTATWTKHAEYRGHRDQPTAVAFTPSGQLLSGSMDTTVLAWKTPAAE